MTGHRQPPAQRRAGLYSSGPDQGCFGGCAGWPELVEEHGIPVLRTDQPLDPSVVAHTIDLIRREREIALLRQR